MTDPFSQDAARRAMLMGRVYDVRLALCEAHERQDAAAALKALGEAYELLDCLDGAQLLYVGEHGESSPAFALPSTCRQITARFGGSCILCDDRFRAGDLVYFDTAGRSVFCARCSVQELLGARP